MAEPTVQQMIDFTKVRSKTDYDSNLQFSIDLEEVGLTPEDLPVPVNISANPDEYAIWKWEFTWGHVLEDQSRPFSKRWSVVDLHALSKFF